MNLAEASRLAVATLWGNRLRSFLTVLGNVVAVLSVVALVAVIQGLDRFVSRELLATGSNTFIVTKFGIIMNAEEYIKALARPDLSLDDARHLERRMTTALAVVPSLYTNAAVKRGRNEAADAPVIGTGAGYPLTGRYSLADGRDLTDADVNGNATVAVIGSRVAAKLFPAEDPVGRDLRVNGFRYTVVGVQAERGGTAGNNQDDQVLVPVTTLLKQAGGRGQSLNISVVALDAGRLEAAQEEAELLLKIHRGLKPWDKPDFAVMTDDQLFGIYRKITAGIYGLLLGVVSLSLLIGGIVIMNIMLVSVTERTREIGIRKAVGARRRDIVMQFLVESVFLAAGGGVIGVLLGVVAAVIVRAASPLPASVQPWSVVLGMLLSSSVGIFFGIYPAWRASRLSPIAALRHES